MNALICSQCQTKFKLSDPVWKCECGGLLDIEFESSFPVSLISKRKSTIWRYREALPLENDSNIVSFDEGFTPLLTVTISGRPVLIKQDSLFPTGSFKDRGASVLISKLKELGIKRIVEDSSGNAGAAIAAYAAQENIDCDIFVPEHTSEAKTAQIRLYGAKLHYIPGTRADVALAALEASENAYYASHALNPFFLQGTKTFAYELCEQLGWNAPDSVVLPVGNGTLLLGAYLGFKDLLKAGIIERLPRLIAVQSVRCNPLFRVFKKQVDSEVSFSDMKSGGDSTPGKNIAEGIAVAEPVRGKQILDAVRESGGDFISVDETAIIATFRDMCGRGYFIEPTSVVALAGLSEYAGNVSADEIIASVFTGHGMKTSPDVLKFLQTEEKTF